MKNEFMELLKIFQQGYLQRDTNKIDAFMEALFDKNESVLVVGTSGGEWCIGYEEVKEIFLSDWEYWGDLRLKAEEARIVELGNTALIFSEGTIKYSFHSNKDTYTRHLGYVKEYFDGISFDSQKANKLKLTEINWKLCHLLNKWEGEDREYLWDLRVSFVLIKKEARWIIKQMQFSLPVVGYSPDVRLENIGYDIDNFNLEGKKLKEYSVNNTKQYEAEILNFLEAFNKEYLKTTSTEIANKYFASKEPLIIGTDKTLCVNQEEIMELVAKHKAAYDEMDLNYENCIVSSNEEVAWLVTNGIMKKRTSEESALENTVAIINNIFTSDLEDKDKLFNIRRRIADTLKENARGEEAVWPFRLEAVLIKENSGWVFKYLQFSLPFSYILEGKTEASTALIEE